VGSAPTKAFNRTLSKVSPNATNSISPTQFSRSGTHSHLSELSTETLLCSHCSSTDEATDFLGENVIRTEIWGMITNDVSEYVNLLVRIAHIICNHSLFFYPMDTEGTFPG